MIKESQSDPDSSLAAWLAHDLRFYRTKRGLSQGQLSKIIGRSPASISNCESGRRMINEDEARILDDLWETGGHFRRLVKFTRRSHNPDWFGEHVSYEARAAVIRTYEALWVPGLLQTRDYALASFEAAGVHNADKLMEERFNRQEILSKQTPPLLEVLLDQSVLVRHVGGSAVMAEQLQHLADVANRPDVILRVVPFTEGAHMGQDGSFKILTVDNGDVAYVEAPIGGRLITEPSEVRSSVLRWTRIGAKALPEGPSKALILSTMENMS